jgi:hypothetical protein
MKVAVERCPKSNLIIAIELAPDDDQDNKTLELLMDAKCFRAASIVDDRIRHLIVPLHNKAFEVLTQNRR